MDNKKIKIAFFLPSLEGGGAERNVINLIKGLKDKYRMILILGERKGFFLKQVPREVSIIDFNTSSLLKIFLKLIKYFCKDQPDIFISTFPRFNFANLLAKFFSGKKFNFIIVEQTTPSRLWITARSFFHKSISYLLLPYLLRFFYPKAEAIVCVSEGIKKDHCKFINSLNKIRVIYNPVVEENIYKLAEQKISHIWFKDKKTPVILTMGRLVKAKDYPVLLRSFKLVLEKKPVRLVVLGDGEEEKKIKELSKKTGVSRSIDFLGFQENPYRFLSKASVFVISSLREGFSNSIVEAMACGVPVVATDCAGPKEIIKNNKNGILVPIGDEKSLAQAVIKILNNPVLAQNLSKNGKVRAKDFTVEKSVQEYDKLFQELLYA